MPTVAVTLQFPELEARNIDLGPLNAGDTDLIRPQIFKDQVPWNLNGSPAVITFTFKAPDRLTTFQRTANNEATNLLDPTKGGNNGFCSYLTQPNDFLNTVLADGSYWVGKWTLGIGVVDGTIIKKYPFEVAFTVRS